MSIRCKRLVNILPVPLEFLSPDVQTVTRHITFVEQSSVTTGEYRGYAQHFSMSEIALFTQSCCRRGCPVVSNSVVGQHRLKGEARKYTCKKVRQLLWIHFPSIIKCLGHLGYSSCIVGSGHSITHEIRKRAAHPLAFQAWFSPTVEY